MVNDSKKILNVVPENPLKANTAYLLKLSGIASSEGIIAPEYALNFVTIETTRIGDDFKNQLQCYPNPFNDYLVVEVPDNGYLLVIDNSGKVIFEKMCYKGVNRLNTSELSKGYYLLELSLNDRSVVFPVIK